MAVCDVIDAPNQDIGEGFEATCGVVNGVGVVVGKEEEEEETSGGGASGTWAGCEVSAIEGAAS